jgi:hypothetical protein
MTHAQTAATRTLTLVLTESDWRAFRDAEPDAIGWLQQQIRQRLAAKPAPGMAGGATEMTWGEDEY